MRKVVVTLAAVAWMVGAFVLACTGDDPSLTAAENDAAAGDDAGKTDASQTDAGDSAPVRFCENEEGRAAQFCDDFERAGDVLGAWSGKTEVGATLTIQSDGANRYLHGVLNADAGTLGGAYLLTGSGKSVAKSVMTCRVRFVGGAASRRSPLLMRRGLPPSGQAYVEGPILADAGAALRLVVYGPDGGFVTEQLSQLASSATPQLDRWYSLRVEMTFAPGSDRKTRLFLDGFEQANIALPAEVDQGPVEALVGLANYSGNAASFAIDIDDVTFAYSDK